MESAGFHRGGRRKPVIPHVNIASWTQGSHPDLRVIAHRLFWRVVTTFDLGFYSARLLQLRRWRGVVR